MSFDEEVKKSKQVVFVSQAERKNARFQRYMEDAHTIIPCLDGDESIFYASVFDGHGGRETAEYVSKSLHMNLIEALHLDELATMEKKLEYAYYYTDMASKSEDIKSSGSTGATILICNENEKCMIYSANAGDSRSILYSNGKTIRLSHDHKATDEDEEKRITEVGGFIMNKRVLGILAVSRSFGDHSCKRFVTAEPYIQNAVVTEKTEFVVIGCDGVFDVLSDEDVTALVKEEVNKGNTEKCAEAIIKMAVNNGSTDNITAIVIGIHDPQTWT